MKLQIVLGLLLAIVCAAGTNLSGLWKQRGACETRDVDIRQPLQTAIALFKSKWFTIGWIVAVAAWLLHIAAIALAPLSLAQAVIAGGLVLLGVFAERFFGFDVNRRQWIALVIASLGMAVLAGTGGKQPSHSRYEVIAIAAFEGGVLLLGSMFVLSSRIDRLQQRHGVLLGAAAGLLFGLSDVSIKAVTTGTHGALGFVNPWTLLGVLAGIAAFYVSARSFQIGNGVAVITASAAAANIVGILGGIVVFGDPLGNDSATVGGRVAAFVLVIAAVSLIPAPTRARAKIAEEQEQEQGQEHEQHREHEAAPARSAPRPSPSTVAP